LGTGNRQGPLGQAGPESSKEVNMAHMVNKAKFNREKLSGVKSLTSSKGVPIVAGGLLFSFGITLLTANLDALAVQASGWFSATPGSLGAAIEIGLAGLRAVQAYFFDPSSFQAGFLSILVSLWPLILVIIGAILLHGAVGVRFASTKLARSFSSEEYESES